MAPKSNAPEWRHVRCIDQSKNKYKCNFCDHEITGTLTRVRDHFLGLSNNVVACKKVDFTTKAMLSRVHERKVEHSNKRIKISQEIGHFPGFTSISSTTSQHNPSQSTLNESWKTAAKEEVDAAVARYFFANGVPFNHLRSPYFTSMVNAISNFGKNYKHPSYESVRTKYLEREVVSISSQLNPIRDSWQQTGCTILSDGWCDKRKRPLINVLAQSLEGVMFLKAVDASDDKKTSEYIADIITETIMEVGVENVVHVVTDSATNCKGAGKILMERFPTLFWSPCVAHVLDLLLEDINEISWVQIVVDDAKHIAKFITNHRLTLSRFRSFASRDLLTPADTRFATNFITLQRIVEEKDALQSVVVGRDWTSSSLSKTDVALHVTKVILGLSFWEGATKVMNIFEPLVVMLRLVDGEAPVMGNIYEGMDRAKEKIREAFNGIESDYIPVWEMVDSRWDMMHTPLHAAACYLNPHSFGTSQIQDGEVLEGLYDCMEKMYPDRNVQEKIRRQVCDYINEVGLCGRRAAKEDRGNISPLSWWKLYGCSLPELQKFAIRILGQPCSSSACERNWSTFDFIHTKKRNKLKSKQLESLVFVHSNLRLLSRNLLKETSESNIDGPHPDDVNVNSDEGGHYVDSSDDDDVSS